MKKHDDIVACTIACSKIDSRIAIATLAVPAFLSTTKKKISDRYERSVTFPRYCHFGHNTRQTATELAQISIKIKLVFICRKPNSISTSTSTSFASIINTSESTPYIDKHSDVEVKDDKKSLSQESATNNSANFHPEIGLPCDEPSCSNSRHSFILQRQDEFEEIHFADYRQHSSVNSPTDDFASSHFQTNDQNVTMPENDVNANYNPFAAESLRGTSQDRPAFAMAPYEATDDKYSHHQKLTRLVPREVTPICIPSGNCLQPPNCVPSEHNKFDTQIMLGDDMRAQIALQPKSDHENLASPSFTNANEVFMFNSQGHRDDPYHCDYYDNPNNVFNSIFGYSSKAHNWFNGILGCLKPFWTIIGQKESQGEMHDDWEIPFEHLKDLQFMGSGAQGAVFMGKFYLSKIQY